MTYFGLTAVQACIAFVIGILLAIAITFAFAPHPVITPPQIITPVPTPPPVVVTPEPAQKMMVTITDINEPFITLANTELLFFGNWWYWLLALAPFFIMMRWLIGGDRGGYE